MLSRTAENLYWLARYVERAEYLARTIEATQRVTALPHAYVGKTNEWDSALLTAGVSAAFYEIYEEADEKNVVEYLSFSTANPSSIRNCIENARLNSRSVRTALTGEMWDTINSAWIELQEVWSGGAKTREQLARFLRFVQETSLRFDGSAYRTMLRNDAYWFSRLGLHLERADNTARILDVKYHVLLPEEEHVGGPLDYYQWTSILRSVSALTAYHWVYRETLKPWLIADLLILNDSLPRSLAIWCATSTRSASPMAARAQRSAMPAASATASSTATWTISSSTACMNSSRNSFPTTRDWAKSSASNI